MLHDSRSGVLREGTGLWVLGQGCEGGRSRDRPGRLYVRRETSGQGVQTAEEPEGGDNPLTSRGEASGRGLGRGFVWQEVWGSGWQVRAFSLAG